MLKRQSAFSDVKVGLLGAIPYLVLFIAMQVNGYLSDKSRERHWHSAIPLFIAAAGLLGLVTQPQSIPLSLVLFTMVAMGSAYLPAFWGDRDRNPESVGGSGRSWNDQCRWKRCRLSRLSATTASLLLTG
jgi:hypothetical protein